MEFFDTPEQEALRDALRSFTRKHATPERVRAAMASQTGIDEAAWKSLSNDLGLLGLAVPESVGGAGAGFAEVTVAVEELGRVLLPSPYASSALVVLLLAESVAPLAEELLPGLADGSLVGAPAWHADLSVGADGSLTGTAGNVVDGAAADVFLIAMGRDLLAVRASAVTVTPQPTLDQTRPQASLRLDAAPAVRVGESARALALHRVLTAAECLAGAEHCLDVTVGYLKTREQFGRPIGSFQALKHRCADLAVEVAAARSAVRAAVWTAALPEHAHPEQARPEVSLAALAPLAALVASRTFTRVTGEMIQLHGGIGFTWEHEAHLYFKRAKSSQLLLGSDTALRAEIGRVAGLLR
ncbi:MAG TPA: acyl-CoA dehydrogenase family protein [Jatrophihabitans sp.]